MAMATPTPGRQSQSHPQSQSQGRTPQFLAGTPPVSVGTPFSQSHLNMGARASPQGIKKSPAMGGGHGGGFYDSPGGAVEMEGVGSSQGAEDTKARRLEKMIEILSGKKPIVTRASLVRVAHKLGLDYLEEGTQDCILAGKLTSVDVSFNNNIVTATRLALDEASDHVKKHLDSANDVLFKDLQLGPYQSPLTKTVERFEQNLQRLATLDRIWFETRFDPHEALIGMMVSLETIYQMDLQRTQAKANVSGVSPQMVLSHVMCARHGYPAMNARQQIGLSIQYWKESRLLPDSYPVNVQGDENKNGNGGDDIWSLLLTCAPAPMDTLPFGLARISSAWVTPEVFKMAPTLEETTHSPTGDVIDWLHPDNTMVPEGEYRDKLAPGVPLRLPQVIFKAELHPPVFLTQPAYANILQMTGASGPEVPQAAVTYDGLFFPHPKDVSFDASEPRTVKGERKVTSFGGGRGDEQSYGDVEFLCDTTLFVYKPVYAEVLREFTFSHPSQVVGCLPILRQYAFLSTLLQKSFPQCIRMAVNEERKEGIAVVAAVAPGDGESVKLDGQSILTRTPMDSEAMAVITKDFEEKDSDNSYDRRMDVTLITYPAPRLQVAFAVGEKSDVSSVTTTTMTKRECLVMANITVEIGLNGEVTVLSQNVLPRSSGGDLQVLGRTLMIMEDLGAWCEWMRVRMDWEHLMGTGAVNENVGVCVGVGVDMDVDMDESMVM